MISFVWSSKYPFMAGSGGSESYTAGHIRELQRRGIECRILTIGHEDTVGSQDFPDITFQSLASIHDLEELDDTIIFITYGLNVKTKRQSYVILHCPPPLYSSDPLYDMAALADKKLIATSTYAAKMWTRFYAKSNHKIPRIAVVYPFAEPAFSKTVRPKHNDDTTRILFAGRLTPDKGIYTLLASLHLEPMKNLNYKLTITEAGSHSEDGAIIRDMLRVHPGAELVPAKKTPQDMAQLMGDHDIVLMPTTDIFWKESFGILSVEAQHAGCRVVASKSGGLPETNSGGMIIVKPDDPMSLANGTTKAALFGPLSAAERSYAANQFTLEASVDALLEIIGYVDPRLQTKLPQKAVKQLPRLYPLSLSSIRLKQ